MAIAILCVQFVLGALHAVVMQITTCAGNMGNKLNIYKYGIYLLLHILTDKQTFIQSIRLDRNGMK